MDASSSSFFFFFKIRFELRACGVGGWYPGIRDNVVDWRGEEYSLFSLERYGWVQIREGGRKRGRGHKTRRYVWFDVGWSWIRTLG